MRFEYVPQLSTDTEQGPLYAQIARAIAGDITAGRLPPGAKLPGSRSLAKTLSVHRNTINAALSELLAQGWVETRPARGVFVRVLDSAHKPRRFAKGIGVRERVPERLAVALRAEPREGRVGEPPPRGVIDLRGGLPDYRLFPRALLAGAYRRAILSGKGDLLDYGDARGHVRLRVALAEMLSDMRGLGATADDVLVTRGSQQAIWLAAHALLSPGDRVVVESFGYQPAWLALRGTGADLTAVPVDREGMSVDKLKAELRAGPIRAVYLTPHHQYPTTVSLSGARRLELLALAKLHRFVIIEDDYSFEFHYDGQPRLPMASADTEGSVVYVGALSKVLAPGLRLGYAVAPRPLLSRMAELRTLIDRQGDNVAEAAVADLMEEGEITRHIRKMRRVYHARRDHFAAALRSQFSEDELSFEVPAGGMALWAKIPRKLSPEAWALRAEHQGVLFRPGSLMAWQNRKVPCLRLGFTRANESELSRAVEVLRSTYRP